MRVLACCLLFAAAVSAPESLLPVDWHKLEPEILADFTTLLKIDTSNPPGNETRAAKAIQTILEREGIRCRLFALDPARANLVARIKGSGKKKPILILGHTDVVGVQRDRWTVDPFGAINRNGTIYARGARDDKPHVVAGMMILLLLKRMNIQLDRDVIFLAEAGEEGTTHLRHRLHGERALAGDRSRVCHRRGRLHRGREGQGPSRADLDYGEIAAAAYAWWRTGPPATARAQRWRTPSCISPKRWRAPATGRPRCVSATPRAPTSSAWRRFRRPTWPRTIATSSTPPVPPRPTGTSARHEPGHYSILRTSVVPTIINVGFRSNVIPSEGEATLDVRALPDEDMTKFVAALRRVIDDPSIDVIPPKASARPVAPPSRLDTDMFRAFEKVGRQMFNAPTLPRHDDRRHRQRTTPREGRAGLRHRPHRDA